MTTMVPQPTRQPMKLSREKFHELRDIIYERSGIFFGEQKLYLLEARLSKRISELGLGSFDDYIKLCSVRNHWTNIG